MNMANTLGLAVVAEGVETASQLEGLQRNGCRFGSRLPARPADPGGRDRSAPRRHVQAPAPHRSGDGRRSDLEMTPAMGAVVGRPSKRKGQFEEGYGQQLVGAAPWRCVASGWLVLAGGAELDHAHHHHHPVADPDRHAASAWTSVVVELQPMPVAG